MIVGSPGNPLEVSPIRIGMRVDQNHHFVYVLVAPLRQRLTVQMKRLFKLRTDALEQSALDPCADDAVSQKLPDCNLQIEQGSLYPALYRLEYKGWIRSDWGNSENNRRAKFYRLTAAGKRQLEAELATWDRLSAAIALVLAAARRLHRDRRISDSPSVSRLSQEA